MTGISTVTIKGQVTLPIQLRHWLDLSPGDKVYFEGYENSAKGLDYDDFAKLTIIIKNNHAVFEGKELKTDKEIVKAEKVKDGARVR